MQTQLKAYLDNAATTCLCEEAYTAMLPYFKEKYFNPSSLYMGAQGVHKVLEDARASVAATINADPKEIIFNGGGSEGDNTALRGVVEAYAKKGEHVITTATEHHAVLHTLETLEAYKQIELTVLPVDEFGLVTAEQVTQALRPDTILVSVIFANNEVGTINPIAEIGAVCHEAKVVFHTDAVQAVGHIPVDVKALNVDLLTLTAHKFHGPKGVGALYIRKGIKLLPQITGGGQERGIRAGTENVPGIIGLAAALRAAVEHMSENTGKIQALRDKLLREIPARIPEVKLNGHPTLRLPNNVNFSIRYIEGESILLMLDLNGIAASSGSACTSGSLDPSHVLLAMGLPHEIAHGSLRLSLSQYTTEEEIAYVLETLPEIVKRLRAMSPLYNV
jgi:cysteine desulfurase